ncbi:hypothetical protein [Marininema halotolerans]|uniref:Uncharacterized protein n=1 Tax=Marininema halotolerans TaxID=1155944 RepID=A0A1I6SKR8_9BACL|nr:hypothetical protein [Marininema halotolerans]SFS77546.1 hypothetical protein SAMN05444972_107169 [Marininema halotolerans]
MESTAVELRRPLSGRDIALIGFARLTLRQIMSTAANLEPSRPAGIALTLPTQNQLAKALEQIITVMNASAYLTSNRLLTGRIGAKPRRPLPAWARNHVMVSLRNLQLVQRKRSTPNWVRPLLVIAIRVLEVVLGRRRA